MATTHPILATSLTPIHAVHGLTVQCSVSPPSPAPAVALDLLNGAPYSVAWLTRPDWRYCRIATHRERRIILAFSPTADRPFLDRLHETGHFTLAVEGMIPVRIDLGARG